MQLRNPITVVALALVSVTCSGEGASESAGPVEVQDSSGVAITVNDLSRLASSCRLADRPRLTIGNRPADPSHELYRVFGATVLSDGRIALVNQGSQELRFYSPSGDFVSSSGREGQGPGEFQDAFLVWRQPGDTLWVGDYRPWEFEVFAPSGEWTGMVRPEPRYPNPPRAFGILSDGRLVLGGEDLSERDPDFGLRHLHLVLHDRTGTLIDTLVVVPNGRWGQTVDDPNSVWIYPWFESFAEVAARDHQLALAHGSRPEVRFYDLHEGLRLGSILRWTGVDRQISEATVSTAKRELEEQYADLDITMRERLLAPLVHNDRPIADSFPALINLQVGSDGSIWIKQYRRPGGPPVAAWIRFSDDRKFVCRLEVPSNLEVFEFGANYLLGKEENELGVETVVQYEMFAGR